MKWLLIVLGTLVGIIQFSNRSASSAASAGGS